MVLTIITGVLNWKPFNNIRNHPTSPTHIFHNVTILLIIKKRFPLFSW